MTTPLPTDSTERKTYPLYRGLMVYFPRALAAVAHHSHASNEQHNPGEPLHWAREKSTDHADCLVRHVLEGDWTAVAWRALAQLETELEKDAGIDSTPKLTDEERDDLEDKLKDTDLQIRHAELRLRAWPSNLGNQLSLESVRKRRKQLIEQLKQDAGIESTPKLTDEERACIEKKLMTADAECEWADMESKACPESVRLRLAAELLSKRRRELWEQLKLNPEP